MARKPKEEDMELQVNSAPPKPETFVTKWFRDYAVNNRDDLKMICDLTSRSAEEEFSIHLASGNTETYACVFYATFMSILEFLRAKEKTYNNFTIEIANSINIGFTNNTDEENEKVGNFMPVMEYIGVNRTIVDDDVFNDDPDKTSKNCIRWKELNARRNIEYYKEIQEAAYEKLKQDYRTNLRNSECVIPLFCTFMDYITNVLKTKFLEAKDTDISEVSINILGLFDAYYSFDEENDKEVIEFQPNIPMKLALKNDSVAANE